MRRHTFNQILSSITACLILFHIGVWVGYVSVMIPRFRAGETPVSMTLDNLSSILGMTDVGNVFFTFPAGYLMDRFGRVVVFRIAFLSFLVGMPLILLATTPYHIYLASFLVGVGLCIGYTTTAIYVAEIAKPKIRGSLGSVAGVMWSVGAAITMTIGPYLSFEALTWATLVCPLTGFILTFFIAESPYYYLIHNNEASAAIALSRVRNNAKMNEKDVELKAIRKKVDDDLKDPSNFLELITRRSNRRALLIAAVLGLMRPAGGFICISAYGSTTLPQMSYWDPKTSMMMFSWLNVIFSFLAMSLVDKFGRKPLLLISLGGVCLVSAVSAVFYYLHQKTNVDVSRFAFVPHVGILIFGVFFPIGVGIVPQIYRGELFSVSIKGPASAVVHIITSVMFFVNNKGYFMVDQSIGVFCMYAIFATVDFLGIIYTMIYVFETKGKTLEEIQNLLNS